ncbi:hypothetical protein [Aquimarina agarivorans]|uniref:hypothetical protein n=1 Tax=Aquimarina agarivorans TaxID=980584 RepID=UPI000248F310|nr:hypothetical protein [Aquimarina agarivorans]
MPKHTPSIAYIFERFNKNSQMISYMRRQPHLFPDLLATSLDLNHKQAWRCAMLIGHMMKKNDVRLQEHINAFIDCLGNVKNNDGHQRQLLIILDQMKLSKIQEGKLFDCCMTIWEDVKKIPSTRIRAFWMLLKIAKNYPELKVELLHFTTEYYNETLSPGIKISFYRAVKKQLS